MKNRLFLHKLFAFYSLFFISTQVESQPTTFLKTYNAGDMGYSVREANGISYVVGGGTDYYYNYHWFTLSPILSTNVQLLKTTTNGMLIWEKVYTLPGQRTIATWMEHTFDDGYILTGHASQETTWPPDSNDVLLIKTDASGNIQWSKTFDSGKDELAYCVRQTSDSGYIISCFHDAAPVSLTGTTYAMLIKTDANGNLMWEKKYELAVRDLDTGEALPWVVRQTDDGGYALVGTTAGSHAADVYMIRADATGNLVWAKSYEHDNTSLRFSLGLDIIETLSGDFVIAGSLDKDQTLNQYNYPYILKVNSTGTIIVAKFFDSVPAQLFQAGFSSVEQTTDGGFFFTGMGGYGGFGMLAQLLKTDVDFNVQWSKVYSNDGGATIGSRSGRQTSDGCYVFTGKKFLDGTVLMKTDNLGMISCKNPDELIELTPSIFSVDRFPATVSGINTNTVIMSTQTFLDDTTTLCPVEVAILPIELLSFNATEVSENNIQLSWETASEINNDYFIVEKSETGNEFHSIAIIKGAGNSTFNQLYSTIDKLNESDKTIYYRLKQVDIDGRSSLSPVISFKRHTNGIELISTTSNKNSGTLSIVIRSENNSQVELTITDLIGRPLQIKKTLLTKGTQQLTFEMGDLSSGLYILLTSALFLDCFLISCLLAH